MKLTEAELHVMDILWQEGDTPAKSIAQKLNAAIGWNSNTTYTIIKRWVEKGAIARRDPRYICHALVLRQEAQEAEIDDVANRLVDGSTNLLFASLLEKQNLPDDLLEKLRRSIDEAEKES